MKPETKEHNEKIKSAIDKLVENLGRKYNFEHFVKADIRHFLQVAATSKPKNLLGNLNVMLRHNFGVEV